MRYGKARISQRWSIGGGKALLPRSPDWARRAVYRERWDAWKRKSAKAGWNGDEKVLSLYRSGWGVRPSAVNDEAHGSEDWTRPTGMLGDVLLSYKPGLEALDCLPRTMGMWQKRILAEVG